MGLDYQFSQNIFLDKDVLGPLEKMAHTHMAVFDLKQMNAGTYYVYHMYVHIFLSQLYFPPVLRHCGQFCTVS